MDLTWDELLLFPLCRSYLHLQYPWHGQSVIHNKSFLFYPLLVPGKISYRRLEISQFDPLCSIRRTSLCTRVGVSNTGVPTLSTCAGLGGGCGSGGSGTAPGRARPSSSSTPARQRPGSWRDSRPQGSVQDSAVFSSSVLWCAGTVSTCSCTPTPGACSWSGTR